MFCLAGFLAGVGGGLVVLTLALGDTGPSRLGTAAEDVAKSDAPAIWGKKADFEVGVAKVRAPRDGLDAAETKLLQIAKANGDSTPRPIAYRSDRTGQISIEPDRAAPMTTGTIREHERIRNSASMLQLAPQAARPLIIPPTESEETPVPQDKPAVIKKPTRQAKARRQSATVTQGVNMRAGPDNGAAVLAQVPNGGRINVIKCDYWCEVVFAGERGWIYKDFVRRGGS